MRTRFKNPTEPPPAPPVPPGRARTQRPGWTGSPRPAPRRKGGAQGSGPVPERPRGGGPASFLGPEPLAAAATAPSGHHGTPGPGQLLPQPRRGPAQPRIPRLSGRNRRRGHPPHAAPRHPRATKGSQTRFYLQSIYLN